jgi:GTP-binding protein
MFKWMLYYGVPYTLIATKADKLPRSRRQQSANAAAKVLGAPPYALPYSVQEGLGRQELLERISQVVADAGAANVE